MTCSTGLPLKVRLGKEAAKSGWQEGEVCRESRSLVIKTAIFQAVVNALFIGISPNVTF